MKVTQPIVEACNESSFSLQDMPLTCFDTLTQNAIDTVATTTARHVADYEESERKALQDAHFDQLENLKPREEDER